MEDTYKKVEKIIGTKRYFICFFDDKGVPHSRINELTNDEVISISKTLYDLAYMNAGKLLKAMQKKNGTRTDKRKKKS